MTFLDQLLSLCSSEGQPQSAYQISPYHSVFYFRETEFIKFLEDISDFLENAEFAEARTFGSLDIHFGIELNGNHSRVTCRIHNPSSSLFHWIEAEFPSLAIFTREISWNHAKG
ncbi:MAG: hypothetical protein ACFFFG_11455 [Candidatus Thorarchaeota archaeon]